MMGTTTVHLRSRAMASAQGMADMRRLQEIMASGRKVPNEDDIAFIRAIMDPEAGRLPRATIDKLRPLVARWL